MGQELQDEQAPPAGEPAPVEHEPPPAAHRPLLRQGSTGSAVSELQRDLNATGAQLAVDGDFGPHTRAAVVGFQQGHALEPDGVVGDKTWGALESGGQQHNGQQQHDFVDNEPKAFGPTRPIPPNPPIKPRPIGGHPVTGDGRVLGPETPQAEIEVCLKTGVERFNASDFSDARIMFKRVLELPQATPEQRAQAAKFQGATFLKLGNSSGAVEMWLQQLMLPISEDDRMATLERIRKARSGEPLSKEKHDVTPEERQKADADAAPLLARAGGLLAADKGGENEALPLFEQVYNNPACSPHVRFQAAAGKGRCFRGLGRFEQAISICTEALAFQAQPARGEPLVGGTAEMKWSEREGVLETLRLSRIRTEIRMPLAPKIPPAEQQKKLDQAQALKASGHYAQAEAICRELYEENARGDFGADEATEQRHAEIALALGTCLQRQQRFIQARELFEEVLQIPRVSAATQEDARDRLRQTTAFELTRGVKQPAEQLPKDPRVERLFEAHVFFATGQANLDALADDTLAGVVRMCTEKHAADPGAHLQIGLTGSASALGGAAYNKYLSDLRAKSVQGSLAKQLVDTTAFEIVGEGIGSSNSTEVFQTGPNDNTWSEREVGILVAAIHDQQKQPKKDDGDEHAG
jgi:tetratricopeptide (TPR) repeat protein